MPNTIADDEEFIELANAVIVQHAYHCIANDGVFGNHVLSDGQDSSLIDHIDAYTAAKVAQERERWLAVTRTYLNLGGVLRPYKCLLCEASVEGALDGVIIHADGCPAKV